MQNKTVKIQMIVLIRCLALNYLYVILSTTTYIDIANQYIVNPIKRSKLSAAIVAIQSTITLRWFSGFVGMNTSGVMTDSELSVQLAARAMKLMKQNRMINGLLTRLAMRKTHVLQRVKMKVSMLRQSEHALATLIAFNYPAVNYVAIAIIN